MEKNEKTNEIEMLPRFVQVKEEGCENGECCLWKTKDLAAAEVKADCTSLKAICMKSPGGKCHWFRARIDPSCVE